MDHRTIRRPFHLILDWDGTLTKKDTLHLVGLIGYQHKERQRQSSSVTPWQDIVDAYIQDFSAHQKHYSPKPAERKTLDQERAWLASLTPIENRSVNRVEKSSLFHGVRRADVEQTARWAVSEAKEFERLQLRNGWRKLFSKTFKANSDSAASKATESRVSILSVNWSEAFIRQGLLSTLTHEPPTEDQEQQEALESYISAMEIRANEIASLDSPTGSNGSLSKNDSTGIRTSNEKLANMPSHLRDRLGITPSKTSDSEHEPVIYVGDSMTDLECLLAADIGICVRDEPMGSGQRELAETLQRIGVSARRLGEDMMDAEERVVFWVGSLEEIADSLPGGETI